MSCQLKSKQQGTKKWRSVLKTNTFVFENFSLVSIKNKNKKKFDEFFKA